MTMTKDLEINSFRKRPVVVEACKCEEPNKPFDIANWCNGKVAGVGHMDEKVRIEIPTLEGTMTANYGDWIIKGVNGEFYPCKPDIFEKTYEEVNLLEELIENLFSDF